MPEHEIPVRVALLEKGQVEMVNVMTGLRSDFRDFRDRQEKRDEEFRGRMEKRDEEFRERMEEREKEINVRLGNVDIRIATASGVVIGVMWLARIMKWV